MPRLVREHYDLDEKQRTVSLTEEGNEFIEEALREAGLLKEGDLYDAHNTLGTLYQKTGRLQEAEDEYRRARELNPKSTTPMVNLGSVYIDEAVARAGDREADEVIHRVSPPVRST